MTLTLMLSFNCPNAAAQQRAAAAVTTTCRKCIGSPLDRSSVRHEQRNAGAPDVRGALLANEDVERGVAWSGAAGIVLEQHLRDEVALQLLHQRRRRGARAGG